MILRVYDVSGRLVRSLAQPRTSAGTHALLWDGRTQAGEHVGSGIYFLELHAGEMRRAQRIVMLQ